MTLSSIAEHCFNVTRGYLSLPDETAFISETKEAINLTRHQLMEIVFKHWDPFSKQISFSFNGGKDCQVLLIIYLSCLWEFFMQSITNSEFPAQYHRFPFETLPTVYINREETFETLESLIESTRIRYCLSIYESPRNQSTMQAAFSDYLAKHSETTAIVIGIRHTDPFGEDLECVQETDSDWPKFMRIQPLLHWKLANVWSFLIYSGEEICGLYGLGFTSIGSVNSTIPNPYLKESPDHYGSFTHKVNHFKTEQNMSYNESQREGIKVSSVSAKDLEVVRSKEDTKFFPGWYLIDDALERKGRI